MQSSKSTKYKKSLFIFRRDLRLVDNTGLIAAAKASNAVIPVFFLDPRQTTHHDYFTSAGFACMSQSIVELDEELHKEKSALSIVVGSPQDMLSGIIKRDQIDAVFVNRDYTPFARTRDTALQKICLAHGIDFHVYGDALLVEPEHITTNTGKPYTVFTPFYKKATATIGIPHPVKKPTANWTKLQRTPLTHIDAQKIKSYRKSAQVCIGGRKEGLRLLSELHTKNTYPKSRDFPAQSKTSYLSVHHKFGSISIRESYHQAQAVFGKDTTFIKELFWRDFFTHIAWHFPRIFKGPFETKYTDIAWSKSQKTFNAWKQGITGFPIIDAGMRELVATGYMHNRVRMLTASFLVKDLHINWQWGEKFFAEHLADYDPCVNNGNWQWVASTGCDAQPYFRIFNPWLQQKKFDSDAIYIKKWIPELANKTPNEIHALYKSFVASNYPKPIVDHSEVAKEAKILFQQTK